MYGGHITDAWDRRVNSTYLDKIIGKHLLSNGPMAPYFRSPDPTKLNYEKYMNYIENDLPKETPQIFHLHPNSEIGYLSKDTVILFQTILEVQGGGGGGGDTGDASMDIVTSYIEKTPEPLDMLEIIDALKDQERSPYVVICI